ncbi:(2Fe-2S)-binding protein [Acidobacteria bacterium AB60]|nr:(2Fe-2S)-binding protein [Acidobacteria bacterium AB60]
MATEPTSHPAPAAVVTVRINGRPLSAPAGASVAAVILQSGIPFRTSVSGEPRSALCGMGICEECRATVDGVPHTRTCQLLAADGMDIRTA